MKTAKALRNTLMLVLALTASSAYAAHAYQDQILEVQTRCPRLNCPSESIWVVSMAPSEQKRLSKDDRAAMKKQIVETVREEWPGIMTRRLLKNSNRLRIDRFEKLVVNSEDVGYRVTYSDKAWDLKTCDYDPAVADSLSNCATGRVSESVFVDLKLRGPFHDERARVRFRADGM